MKTEYQDKYNRPVIDTMAQQLPSLYGNETFQTASLTYAAMKKSENEQQRALEELLTGPKSWRSDPTLAEMYNKTIRDSALQTNASISNAIRGMAKMRVNQMAASVAMAPPRQETEVKEGSGWGTALQGGAQMAGMALMLV